LGWDGFAWGTAPTEVARAKATVHLARDRYLATYSEFWTQLSSFVEETQTRAEADARSGRSSLKAPFEQPGTGIAAHIGFLLRLTQSRMRQNGIERTMLQILKYLTIKLPLRLFALAIQRLRNTR
jgi:hypothetical protein